MTWRWFVCDYPSGPRLFRLATDGSAVERATDTDWVSVPGALERLLTDPAYREIETQDAMALAPVPSGGNRKAELVGRIATLEWRAASGEKKGAGGRLEHYAEHGRYAKPGAGGRIAPLSGQTVKQTVAANLTLSALPEAVQAKSTAQMIQSLGVDYEGAVDHLVTMAESASAKGLVGQHWYQEAHAAALTSAERNGIKPEVGFAVVAALSPGTRWEENLRNADAVMSLHSQWDQPIDPAHIRNTNVWANRVDNTTKAPNSKFRAEVGETLGQLYKKDPHLAAVYAAKKTNASVGYSYDNFFKATDLVAANDPAVIDHTLNGAKVRSFFNNISEPTSQAGDVTIDIHMQRAMANDLTSTTPTQKHERMVSISKRSSSITGSPSYAGAALGAMPVMADVTREATRRFNKAHHTAFLPSEFQAVVWTEQIAQFPPARTEAILKAPVP